jgi:hypothetical protein
VRHRPGSQDRGQRRGRKKRAIDYRKVYRELAEGIGKQTYLAPQCPENRISGAVRVFPGPPEPD